jgi:hypothetical protein
MGKTYKYLGYFLLLLIPLTFAGFYKTYFGQFPTFDEKINSFVHFHALIASIWILILIIQPFLIINKKYVIHRAIGKLSYILFPMLILSFIPQILKIINSGNIRNVFFPLSDIVLLIAFYLLAIFNRKTVTKHMRYMIATAIVFLGPTIGRIGGILLEWPPLTSQSVLYGVIYLILISLIFYDKANQKDYTPYKFCVLCYIIHQVTFYLIFI